MPEGLDWDLWCGPAPKIPYSPQVGHVNWRLEKTTGHGHLVELALPRPTAIRRAIIMEQIADGERIREFVLEGFEAALVRKKRATPPTPIARHPPGRSS